jgi:hypothetical protein
MSEGRIMQELLSRAKQDARAEDARAEEARTEQFSVQNGLIFGGPQATQSGCRYSGRPALYPSGQQRRVKQYSGQVLDLKEVAALTLATTDLKPGRT